MEVQYRVHDSIRHLLANRMLRFPSPPLSTEIEDYGYQFKQIFHTHFKVLEQSGN